MQSFSRLPGHTQIGIAICGAVTAFLAGLVAASSLQNKPAQGDPIVRPNAWNEKAPEAIVQVAYEGEFTKCNPWEVSDVAMEEVLREMMRRGWRPPDQGEALAIQDPSGLMTASNPDAPMPVRYDGGSAMIVFGDSETLAEGLEEVKTTGEPAIVIGQTSRPRTPGSSNLQSPAD